jgi:WD40 repeat protein
MNLTKNWAATLDDYVIDLAWSPDGNQLAAASAAGPVSLFSTADGAKSHELPGHENGTNCLAWSPVGSPLAGASESAGKLGAYILATGGQDGAVKFWDAAAGQHTATASLGSAWVEHLAWRPVAGGGGGAPPPPPPPPPRLQFLPPPAKTWWL